MQRSLPAGACHAREPTARPPLERRAVGRHGEQLACAHLVRLGYEIVARNVRTRSGEIDIVARAGAALVFVEVKTLTAATPRAAAARRPLDWLRARQRRRLWALASAWLQAVRGRPWAQTIRFDAIGVVVDPYGALLRLDHVESAW